MTQPEYQTPTASDEPTAPSPGDAGQPSETESSGDIRRRRSRTTTEIDTLVEMFDGTLIDRSGKVYCTLPTQDGQTGITIPLRSRSVKAYLVARYRDRFGRYPKVSRVNTAIDRVEGQLVSKMRSDSTILECLTWRCLRILIEQEPSGTATARELRRRLNEIRRANKVLKGDEELPATDTAMGMWLTQHQFALRPCGVEISRPTSSPWPKLFSRSLTG